MSSWICVILTAVHLTEGARGHSVSTVTLCEAMIARPLHIEFAGAPYNVTARGNAREDIYSDDRDRQNFLFSKNEAASCSCVKDGQTSSN